MSHTYLLVHSFFMIFIGAQNFIHSNICSKHDANCFIQVEQGITQPCHPTIAYLYLFFPNCQNDMPDLCRPASQTQNTSNHNYLSVSEATGSRWMYIKNIYLSLHRMLHPIRYNQCCKIASAENCENLPSECSRFVLSICPRVCPLVRPSSSLLHTKLKSVD